MVGCVWYVCFGGFGFLDLLVVLLVLLALFFGLI